MNEAQCIELKTRIDALDAEIDKVLTGKRVTRAGYGGRLVETQETSVVELRKRKAELERRYKACGCSPALDSASLETGRTAIRPVFR